MYPSSQQQRPRPAMLKPSVTPDTLIAPNAPHFPSTPQHGLHGARSLDTSSAGAGGSVQRVGFTQQQSHSTSGGVFGSGSMPPRAKSSGDLAYRQLASFSQQRQPAPGRTAASPNRELYAGRVVAEELNQSQLNILQHRFVQVLQAQQRVELHGVKVYREGFTDAFLGTATVVASPTDIVMQFPYQVGHRASIPTNAATAAAPAATSYAQWPPCNRSPPRGSTPTGSPVMDSNAARSRPCVADNFIVLPRLSLASVSYFPANNAGAPQNIGNGALPRDPSAAVVFSMQQGRPSIELRTRDLHIITLVFAANSRAHQPLVNELTKVEHSQFVLGPNRPAPYILYSGTQLAQRLQYPRQLVSAAAFRASVNPHIAQKAVGGGGASGAAEFSMASCLAPSALPALMQVSTGSLATPFGSLFLSKTIATARPIDVAFSTSTPASRGEPGAFPARSTRDSVAASWFLYDADAEFSRQCGRGASLSVTPISRSPNTHTQPVFEDDHHVVNAASFCPVRRTALNADFGLCSTYPPVLYVPSSVDDTVFAVEAKQRARGRVPVCAYYNNATQTCLYRSSQPQNGKDIFQWIMSSDVAKVTEAIRTSCPSQELKVVDLRPYVNAMVNSVFRNGGYESNRRKDKLEVIFANMENVDKVNAAFQEMYSLCTAHHSGKTCQRSVNVAPSAFNAALCRTGWLDLLGVCVTTAFRVARYLVLGNAAVAAELQTPVWMSDAPQASSGAGGLRTASSEGNTGGCNVLIHCSDGWDRTAQVSALVQLLLDPYLRTIKGFCMLVEKEFLHYGHQFKSRAHYPWITLDSTDPIDAAHYPLHAYRNAASSGGDDVEAKARTPPPLHVDPNFDDGDDGRGAGGAAGGDDWDASDQPIKPAAKKQHHHHSVKAGGGGHEACPIFFQFIDAVRQIVEVYPHCFEFTDELLIWLLDAYHSGFYASFSADNYQELLNSGLVGRHTANAFAELAALGGTYPPPTPIVRATDAPSTLKAHEDRETPGSFIEVDGSNLGDSVRGARQDETPDSTVAAFGGAVEDTSLRGIGLVNPEFNWYLSAAEGSLLGLIAPNRLTLWSKYFLRFADGVEPTAVPLRAPIPPELQYAAAQKVRATSASMRPVGGSTESLADWASTAGSTVTSPATHYTGPYPVAPHSPARSAQPVLGYATGTGRSGSAQSGDDAAPAVSPSRVAATRRLGPVGDMAPLPSLLTQSIADF